MVFLAFAAFGGLGAVLYVFVVGYKRRLMRVPGSTTESDQCQPSARWQAGRWDTDARHAYVVNLGDDIAYEVRVMEDQQVVATAPSVPPYSADRLSSTSDRPCYVNFCVHSKPGPRTLVSSGGAAPRERTHSAEAGGNGVAVQVSWRSEHGEWSTQRVHGD
jgi:hypothetical protein